MDVTVNSFGYKKEYMIPRDKRRSRTDYLEFNIESGEGRLL